MLNRLLRSLINRPSGSAPQDQLNAADAGYDNRLEREKATYRDCLNVNDLPKIAAYWHEKHLEPKLVEHLGITHPGGIFDVELLRRCAANPDINSIVSIGSGNCDLEVHLAELLEGHGYSNFQIECLDLNPDMLRRGLALAEERKVRQHIAVTECDFNHWKPQSTYDVICASQSLHHVLNLEGLFDAVQSSMKPDGCFAVSDMIGRNGHMCWPEALEIVNEYWLQLPETHRFNLQLKRYEETFGNWDCSREGFEGIRAQDILPLLIERFHFEVFYAFSNIIDPFIGRSFGHHFNRDGEWDQSFIDTVQLRDEAELKAGNIKPTHLIAVMRAAPVAHMQYLPPMTPEFAMRRV